MPRKVKKGALIRFGGPGAPTFLLKSFSVGFESFIQDEVFAMSSCRTDEANLQNVPQVLSSSQLQKSSLAFQSVDEGENCDSSEPSSEDSQSIALAALVSLNTRLNALGGPAALCPTRLELVSSAANRIGFFSSTTLSSSQMHKSHVSKRRDQDDPCDVARAKKLKLINGLDEVAESVDCTATNESGYTSPTIVSPNPVRGQDSTNASKLSKEFTLMPSVSAAPTSCGGVTLKLQSLVESEMERSESKRVTFSDEIPRRFVPLSVTPDNLSDDE